jgi:hypothetical protein
MYGKLFSSMYDGTLTQDGMWQALVTFQQMIILADKDGVVDIKARALAARTGLPIKIIETGIKLLMMPDDDSRSKLEEGRRIVNLSPDRTWGWQIVNYAFYANLRSTDERREYMRLAQAAHRAKKAIESTPVKPCHDKVGDVKLSTHIDVDIDIDVDERKSKAPRKRGSSNDEGFERFWAAHPYKSGKLNALKAWKKLAPSTDLLDEIIAALEKQKSSRKWTDNGGAYIPLPATWLNGRGWEDQAPDVQHVKLNRQQELEERNRLVGEQWLNDQEQ